ncbi:betaine--homocysteine S-methyltransferase 1 [Patella vulgata]|uniref:betaine--homocysteine S-methyltransferase 1 n=1 Tax=Patella vulgata TaxID=6465 RepID=UPI00217F4C4A|nr:betaine--homocysteine S-methyltransferase 1 [Patella vulgata]
MSAGLLKRLKDGDNVICAEGYMWELERRGYLRSGVFTPEIILDQPERVRNLHEEFVHAGSDVVEAFTYYGHREKMRIIGREDELETLNLKALKIAREVADSTNTLMAGNLSNTTSFDPDDPKTADYSRHIFKEQVEWAVKGGADYIIGETFSEIQEAHLALEAIQKYGNGLPAVITLVPYSSKRTVDGVPFPQALRQLEEAGAAVVGINCGRGPATMIPMLKEIRQVCKGPIAALPVPFRTTPKEQTFQSLTDPVTGKSAYPLDLSAVQCSRSDVRQFAETAKEIGVQYIGLCCGSSSFLLREVAEVYGRTPPAAKYSPNLDASYVIGKNVSKHAYKVKQYMFGEDE